MDNRQVRIRDEAFIGCDMHIVKWGDDGEIFEATTLTRDKMKLVAPGYGKKPYGNGPLYVNVDDIIFLNRQ